MKHTKMMLTSRRENSKERLLSTIEDWEHRLRRLRESLEEGRKASGTFLQHSSAFAEEVGIHNTLVEALEMIEAEAPETTQSEAEAHGAEAGVEHEET